MVRCAIVIGLLCCASLLLHAAPALATPPTGYNLVYNEDFNGTSINDTKFGYQWTGYPGVYATADGVSVSGGSLTLTTYTTNTGGTLTNWGACVASEGYSHTWNGPPINYQYTYGYVEARLKINNNLGNNPAFWLESDQMFTNPAPTSAAPGDEVDIIEHDHAHPNNDNINIWWGGYGGTGSHNLGSTSRSVSNLENSFHTFGMLWTPTYYKFYVDDVLKYTLTDPTYLSQGPEFVVLDTSSNNWGGNWSESPPAGGYGSLATSTTRMGVDYVRIYQLPVTWTGGSGTWATAGNWTAAGSIAVPNFSTNIAMTGGGTISLSGGTQSVLSAGVATSGLVGTLTNGSLTFACDLYMKSGTINVDLSNAGIASHLWIGGDSAASVYLGGNNNTTCASDFTYGNAATIIGHTSVTGAAGTVKLTGPNALNAAGQSTDIYSGTLDLNGQVGIRSAQIRLMSGGSSSLINGNTSAAASYANILDLGGGTPNLGGEGSLTLSGTLQNGGFVKIGAGTLTLIGANTYTGPTTVSAGTLQLGNGTTNGSVAGASIVDNAALVFSNATAQTYGGVISGSGTVAKNSAGTLTLTSANSYTGLTTVSGGVLEVQNVNALGATSVGTSVGSGYTLKLSGNGLTMAEPLTINGGGISSSIGALYNTGGNNTWSGPIALGTTGTRMYSSGGTLTITGGLALGSQTLYTGSNIVIDSVISGAGAILIQNIPSAGTLTLKGANTYTGSTYFHSTASGVLNIQNSQALGTAAAGTTIVANSTLQLQPNAVTGPLDVVGEALSIAGTGYSGLGALDNLSGNNTWTGTITLTGAAQVNSDSGLLAIGGNIVNSANLLTIGGAGNTTISGVISPAATAGGLTKVGAGTLVLTGANAYTGLTTVEGGTLELGAIARNPVLTLGGADIMGGKLVFDYTGATILSTVQTAVDSGVIYRLGANPPLICLDNLSNAVTVESTLLGDATLDGAVNGADLNTVLSNYNQSGTDWAHGDFDGNGTVNGADLNTVLSNYNQHVGLGAAVPEPSTVVLLGVGAVGLLAYAWRRRGG